MHISKYLNSQDSEDDEESAADEDYVANRFKRGEKGLYNQFQTRSPVDHPEGSQSPHQPKNPQHPKDLALFTNNGCNSSVYEGYDDQSPIHPVPIVGKVTIRTKDEADSNCFHDHLSSKNNGEDVIGNAEDVSFCGPRWNVRPLHGQSDTIGRNERENDEIKPSLRRQILAENPESERKILKMNLYL